ncbi:DUF4440 domain-containing protein [bacterium]|nr:DUF4440 domain-containing protein [bacterium]
MRSLRQYILIAAILVTFGASPFAQDGPPAPDDRAQIESRVAQVVEAVANKDVDRVVSVLADSVVITAEGRTIRGRANARQLLNLMSTRLVDVTFSMATEILRLDDSSAFHAGDFTYRISFPGGASYGQSGRFIADWHKIADNDWRIAQLVAVPKKPDESTK